MSRHLQPSLSHSIQGLFLSHPNVLPLLRRSGCVMVRARSSRGKEQRLDHLQAPRKKASANPGTQAKARATAGGVKPACGSQAAPTKGEAGTIYGASTVTRVRTLGEGTSAEIGGALRPDSGRALRSVSGRARTAIIARNWWVADEAR